MKEPLLWFALIGVLLFAADQYRQADTIIVDDGIRARLSNLWQAQMGIAPSEAELSSLTENWIREEIFYREALRLGLDQGDTIVRRRLVQKLGFLMEEVDEESITREEIDTYYRENLQRYTLPERFSLSQVFFTNRNDAGHLLEKLRNGANWREMGEATLLPREFVARSRREIASNMGEAFVKQFDELKRGTWVGPVESTFGFHLVRLEEHHPSAVTPLVHVEKQVLNDLVIAKREQARDEYFQSLLGEYDVERH